MPQVKTVSTRKAKRRDKLAWWIITLGGVTVIASVVAILALIVGVTVPLFRTPQATVVCTSSLAKSLPKDVVLRLGVDMDIDGSNVNGIVWAKNGSVNWIDLRTGKLVGQERLPSPDRHATDTLEHVESLDNGKYALSWSNGAASLVEIVRSPADKANRGPRYAVRSLATIKGTEEVFTSSDSQPVSHPPKTASVPAYSNQRFIRRSDAGAITRVTKRSDGTIAVLRKVATETTMGDEEVETHQNVLRGDIVSHIRAMAMDREGNTLYAGTDDGRLVRWQIDEKGENARREVVRAFSDGRAITALAPVLGDVSLAVGDAKGGLTIWSPVNADGTRKLQAIHQLQSHQAPIREIYPSGRNKSILSLSEDGIAHLDHTTSERHLVSIALGGTVASPAVKEAGGMPTSQLSHIALGSRGDTLLGLDRSGTLTAWRIDSGCPEISFGTLFGKVFYEGYDKPEYVWQTTGGEEFEPKFSLVPLMFGTLKGTFYAMFFAVPLALFGAMYVSYFTTPGFRRTIKPVIEIMATVPSVVIGFLIALWLAPIIERWALAFFISLIVVPATFVVFMAAWQLMRRFDWARRVENGYEFLVVLPVLLLGVGIAVWLAAPMETWFFAGNFRRWLFEGPLGMQYDQRNNIIIAFGLGFTVIPIIFSIAEDSLSNVPYSMTAASMAVGASRWQTLWRVVLPSASPGIFAAMMIGFGRAVGETMIVLMATGNTPILDWSPLNGMRTLSANIAVEIPEAPVGGTLYRVLFLCAVLLFLLTFTVNTAAEVVRQRLRKRFGRF
jgi:phosphate transport system permease protein